MTPTPSSSDLHRRDDFDRVEIMGRLRVVERGERTKLERQLQDALAESLNWLRRAQTGLWNPHDGERVVGGNFNGSFNHADDCRFCAFVSRLETSDEQTQASPPRPWWEDLTEDDLAVIQEDHAE